MTCTPSTRHLIDGVEPDSLPICFAGRGEVVPRRKGELGVREGGCATSSSRRSCYPMVGDQRTARWRTRTRVGPLTSRGASPRLRAHSSRQRRLHVAVNPRSWVDGPGKHVLQSCEAQFTA